MIRFLFPVAAFGLAALLESCASAPSPSGPAGAPGGPAAEAGPSAPSGDVVSGEKPAFDVAAAPSWPELNLAVGEPEGWTLPEPEAVRGGRTIDLFRADGRFKGRLSTVLHSPGEPSRLERLVETEIRDFRTRLDAVSWSAREKVGWDGLEAVLFEIGGSVEGGALQGAGLGAWDGERYYFVVVSHEGPGTRAEIRAALDGLARAVARVERPRPPQAAQPMFARTGQFRNRIRGSRPYTAIPRGASPPRDFTAPMGSSKEAVRLTSPCLPQNSAARLLATFKPKPPRTGRSRRRPRAIPTPAHRC